MLPQYEKFGSVKNLVKVSFPKFAVAVVLLPLTSFIFCVIWSLLFFFESSTDTHCNVQNYLPSISAAIGNYQPQRIVWQFAICLHILPRFVVAHMYAQYYKEIIRRDIISIAYLACILNIIENCALLGLTLRTSIDDYEIHKLCFITFVAVSEMYMLISIFINQRGRKLATSTNLEARSIKYKIYLFLTNIISLAFAGYCFVRHNNYCEPGMYTFFALFEYIIVFTNMAYHMTAYFDFFGKCLVFDWNNGFYFTHS